MNRRNLMNVGRSIVGLGFVLGAVFMLSACCCNKSGTKAGGEKPAAAAPAAGAQAIKAIRVNAGASQPYTDPNGNMWLADTGFEGGDLADRGDVAIANTNMPGVYRTEHYSMTSFSQAVPNGKYTVKLHFAETYDGITAKGERVFTVKVQDKELKDVDVFAETGGLNKALVKTFDVAVIGGKLSIVFTANVQNPEINGIEIIPAGK
jgi:endoglucanase